MSSFPQKKRATALCDLAFNDQLWLHLQPLLELILTLSIPNSLTVGWQQQQSSSLRLTHLPRMFFPLFFTWIISNIPVRHLLSAPRRLSAPYHNPSSYPSFELVGSSTFPFSQSLEHNFETISFCNCLSFQVISFLRIESVPRCSLRNPNIKFRAISTMPLRIQMKLS